jgi:transposase
MDEITTVGIDLAKEVFAVCILDARGAVVERKVLRRAAFERWAAALAPCTVAMEACGSAHYWGRFFAVRGHTARLIAAEFVVPFRQGGKNDGNDALAIAIAARQPTMRFVPIKTVEQQTILSWHRARAGFNEERTALINRLRGLLAEFGIAIALSSDRLLKALPGLSSDERVPLPVRALLLEARAQFAALHARIG